MIRFFKLQDLRHGRQETHTPLLRRGKHRISCDIRKKATELKNLDARWVFKSDSPMCVFFN